MSVEGASIGSVRRLSIDVGLKPPPRLNLSDWANEHFRMSAESSAQAGRWNSLPYQIEILNAITDPKVVHISVMKSARIGYTLMVSAALGYYIHQEPCSILMVQPTVDDAKGYSKENIAPMLRDIPVLSKIMFEDMEVTGPKSSSNTITHKSFPGGVLSLAGANSGAGLRRVSRRVVIFDEVDAYPPSAGSDGDPVKLGTMRSEYFWNRKVLAGSTPLIAGSSRIEQMFTDGDQRKFYVPCPQCGFKDVLVFRESKDGGHYMQWPADKPKEAHFVCSENGCVIEHSQKRQMVAAGEWRAAKPFNGHASFHVWAAYSFSPNATWGQIAEEFVAANKGGSEKLRVFVNTVLGETWKESGDAPSWEKIYNRREDYLIDSVPAGPIVLTCGVDVQKDRWVYEVVGWGADKQSWSIDAGVIFCDTLAGTTNEDEWAKLNELLNRTYQTAAGTRMAIHTMAVDSGFNTQQTYSWTRKHPPSRVMAVKGMSTTVRLPVGTPTPVDVTSHGKVIKRGARVWPVGSDMLKAELYGWLRLEQAEDGSFPDGYCHFPGYDEEYFKQLTAEHLVSSVDRRGFKQYEWQQIGGRENHFLDARNYARAASIAAGLDRMAPPRPSVSPQPAAAPAHAPVVQTTAQVSPRRQIPDTPPRKSGGWLSKRR